MTNEIWKEVKGFSKYRISNTGKLKRNRTLKGHKTKGGIMVNVNNKDNIKLINLGRLVAQHFIENPNNLPCVLYKDNNPYNTNASNLYWAHRRQRKAWLGKFSYDHSRSIPVQQLDKQDNVINEFGSALDAQRELNINSCNISKVCHRRRATAGGYKWKHLPREQK